MYRFSPALASLVLLVLPLSAQANEISLAEAFSKTARWHGDNYQMGRDLLAREGQRIVPFLKEKLQSNEKAERELAAALLARITHSKEAASIDRLRNGYNHSWEVQKDGTIRIRFGDLEGEWAKKQPSPLVAEAVLTRASLPILYDVFRAESSWGSYYRHGSSYMAALLADFRDVEAIPVLFRWYPTIAFQEETFLANLVKIGPGGIPHLRDAVEKDVRGAAIAVRALAKLKDQESAPLFLHRLGTPKQIDNHAAYAWALTELKYEKAIPALFDTFARAAHAQRRGESSYRRPTCDDVRSHILSFGKSAAAVLRERARTDPSLRTRVLTQGLLWRIEHPEEWARLAPAVGKQMKIEAARGYDGLRHREELWEDDDIWSKEAIQRLHWPAAISLEYAYINANEFHLAPLTQMKAEPLAYEILANLLREADQDKDLAYRINRPQILEILAALQDERAIEVFREQLHPRQSWVYASMPGLILTLNSKKGISVLETLLRRIDEIQKETTDKEEIKQYESLRTLTRAVIAALDADRDALGKLLQEKSVRHIAAASLARQHDLRAIPVLVEVMASAEEGKSSRWYSSFTSADRELVVKMGAKALPTLEKLAKETTDWKVKLICESCSLRIREPKLAHKYQVACQSAIVQVRLPMIPSYSSGGGTLAQAVGKDGIPLIEASLVMGTDIYPLCSAYALGYLKEERSIDVVVKMIPHLWSNRDRDIGPAGILGLFGPKGIEAAKKVPPPDPKKAFFEHRSARSRVATEALAAAEDPKGIENIVEFFNRPIPRQGTQEHMQWANRVSAYLVMSMHYEDERLKVPILKLLDIEGNPYEYGLYETMLLYKDQRLIDCALNRIGRLPMKEYWKYDKVFNYLAVQGGTELPAALLKRYRESKDEKVREEVLFTFEQMASYPSGGGYWRVPAFQHQLGQARKTYLKAWGSKMPGEGLEKKVTDETAELQARAREAHLVRRLAELDEMRGQVQQGLQHALVELLKETLDAPATELTAPRIDWMTKMIGYASHDKKKITIKPLIDWLKKRQELPYHAARYLYYCDDPLVTETFIALYGKWQPGELGKKTPWFAAGYLERRKDPKMPEIILKLYREGDCWDKELARILGEHRVTEAIEDLAKHARRDGDYVPMHALCQLGPKGQERALQVYREAKTFSTRWNCLATLSFYDFTPRDWFDDVAPKIAEILRDKHVPEVERITRVSTYAGPLVRLDPRKSYVLLAQAFFQAQHDDTQQRIVLQLRNMETEHPRAHLEPVLFPLRASK